MFSPWIEFGKRIMKTPMNIRWFIVVDKYLCCIFKSNWKYQRKTFFDKFAPGSIFVKYTKREGMQQ